MPRSVRSIIGIFLIFISHYSANGQVLKSLVYDFDGLDIGQTSLPEGDYYLNDLRYQVAANPLASNDMLGDRVLKLNLNWNAGNGTFGRGISRYIEFDPNQDKFNFFIYNPVSNNQNAILDVLIADDDDKSNNYNYSNDDSWKKSLVISGSSGWQFISIPLKDFIDSNPGGNGIFDIAFTQNKGMLLQVEFRFNKTTSVLSNPVFYIDMINFSEGDLPRGATVFDLPNKNPSDYCLLGAYDPENKGEANLIPVHVESLFPVVAGKKLKYANYFLQWAMDGTAVAKELPRSDVQTLINNGYTPIITWEPQFQGYDRLDPVQPRLNNIINGDYNSYIDAFADKIKTYTDTVIIRFMHEFEGNWYPWSISQNNLDPSLYVTAFRMVVDRFRARGVNNVQWMWCVNSDYYPYLSYNWIVPAYPGDNYVDIVATDIYNNHYPTVLPWWRSFRWQATESYYYLTKYFPQKPLYICEVGCRERKSTENTASQSKGAWFAQMDKELQADYHNARALIFFNAVGEQNWAINSSSGSIQSLTNNIWHDDYYFKAFTTPTALSVIISSPATNSSFTTGSTINIQASVSGGTGPIQKVEFFAGTTKLAEDLTSPYNFAWNNATAGSYALTAKVTDNTNTSASSTVVNISVVTLGIDELISAGSGWKYLDNGTNQGTAWTISSFNDATWKTGNAELGYGDGGEATMVSYGPSSTNKYITTYFRNTFNVIDKSTISGLELSLIRDDGAVVYINGVEVYRTNLPAGTINYNTLAPSAIDGTNESTWLLTNLSSSSLVNGSNIIAVELHQSSKTSSDISFNLKLKAQSNAPSVCQVPSGLTAGSITSGSATLGWSAVTNALSYNVQYRITGTTSWITSNSTINSKAISGLSPSSTYEFQVSAVCSSSASNYSPPQTFITLGQSSGTELISAGSSWKYLDNGTNQGTTWRATSFSDAAWKTGNAELGYGDGGESTLVSYGASSTKKHITTYFRKTFNIIDKSIISGLELSLIRDDGAVVYINGIEVYRTNLPSGSIYYNTLAPTYVDGANESAWLLTNLSSSSLLNGTNVIAVEIHQNAVTSSDISFNLKLKTLNGAKIPDNIVTDDNLQQNIILESNYQMIVYPNPTTGQFTLEFCIDDLKEKIVVIEVTNSLAQVVYKKQPRKVNGCIKETIELESNLSTGVYILKVTIDDRIQTSRMLLTR